MLFSTTERIRRLEARVALLEQLVSVLCDQAGVNPGAIDLATGVDPVERALISQGKRIEAIKHHRERTGSSLTEAKAAIDRATH